MATFTISLSVVVDAEDYDQAYAIQKQLLDKLVDDFPEVKEAYEIDVEQQDDFEDDGQPDEAQEWFDFDPDC